MPLQSLDLVVVNVVKSAASPSSNPTSQSASGDSPAPSLGIDTSPERAPMHHDLETSSILQTPQDAVVILFYFGAGVDGGGGCEELYGK
tara:strand:+ start:18518 stop:18784 length:267 start_codon:yes stop_codon:yes gene_type:complete